MDYDLYGRYKLGPAAKLNILYNGDLGPLLLTWLNFIPGMDK